MRLARLPLPEVGLFGLGLLMAHHPMILSGMARVQTDVGDTRFNGYLLEHAWRWVSGDPLHASFWDPPFFFPQTNVLAYSDLLLSLGPLYWPWRVLGLEPDTAFQLWMLGLSTLNFWLAWGLLRRGLGIGRLGAGVGAFLFAFGASRIADLEHVQMLGQFFALTAAWGLIELFSVPVAGPGGGGGRRLVAWIGLVAASIVAQIYAGFYHAWFLLLALALSALVGLARKRHRTPLVTFLRAGARPLAVGAGLALAASVLLLLPVLLHYGSAAQDVGMRAFADEVLPRLPRITSWFFVWDRSWLYAWQAEVAIFAGTTSHQLSIGWVTTVIAALGLWRARDRPVAALLAVTTILLILLVTRWPGDVTLWRLVFEIAPGGQAIRAPYRLAIFLLLPAAIGVALFFDHYRGRWSRLWLGLVAGVCILEQGGTTPAYDKAVVREEVATLAAAIPKNCAAFYASFRGDRAPFVRRQLDAVWAASLVGRPTVNGYSGNRPPGWQVFSNVVQTREQEAVLGHRLQRWIKRTGLAPETVCRVEMASPAAVQRALENEGGTALHAAILNGDRARVRNLIQQTDALDATGNAGRTPLMTAVRRHDTEAIAVLLAAGAELDRRDDRGATALMWSTMFGEPVTVATLLEAGADPNLRDHHGATALGWAALFGRAAVVEELLGRGADPNLADQRGTTPLAVARERGYADVIAVLAAGSL